MSFFLISTEILFWLVLINLLFLYLLPPLGLFLIVFTAFVVFVLRKKRFKKISNEQWSSKLFVSPVSGKIIQISETETLDIFIKVGILSGWGIYNPLKSRVLHFGFREGKRRHLPFWKSIKSSNIEEIGHDFLELEAKKYYYHYQFYKPSSMTELTLNVDTGDIGHVGSCIGFLAFGGIVKIVLPDGFKVLVNEGDRVKSVRTLLAKMKRDTDEE